MNEDVVHQSSRESELNRLIIDLRRRENELDARQAEWTQSHYERDRRQHAEIEAHKSFVAEREKKLFERQRDLENDMAQRQAKFEALRVNLERKIADNENKHQLALIEFQREKERYNEESRQKIELTSKNYVSTTLEKLDHKEIEFHKISKNWSFFGASSLLLGIAFFAYVTLTSTIEIPDLVTWQFVAFSVFKGIISVVLLAGLAKYSFLFSGSYMREALKYADRRHAINFGKFYLDSYGASADWSQVKEAFEHWNITGVNAFAPSDKSPPELSALENAVVMCERASKAVAELKGGSARARF